MIGSLYNAVFGSARRWWQYQFGEDETPFDGDGPSWIISLCVIATLLVVLRLIPIIVPLDQIRLTLSSPVQEEEEQIELPEEFVFSDDPTVDEVGANSEAGANVALSLAEEISDLSEIPSIDEPIVDTGFEAFDPVLAPVSLGQQQMDLIPVKGAAGVGTTGASGAIDRLTFEIKRSLEDRKTLVVWAFDQSASLTRQREEILERFDRVYDELGMIEASGAEAFAKHEDQPLLSAVVAFGNNVSMRQEPTDNLAEIKQAVMNIERDDSGVERVFSAIYLIADNFRDLRVPSEKTGEPERNVMIITFTDEAGDDYDGLDRTVQICRRYEMPVYVVGVPAPFGRRETLVKWVDPDPEYDQTPQWGEVSQGPESFLPERIKLHFSGNREDRDPIDSGFGPFALTRLCWETGGIYFAVHPNRRLDKAVSRGETADYSAHIEHFFDPAVMRKYRPDYVSAQEYQRRVASNGSRQALLKAAQFSWTTPLEEPERRFVKRSEAALVNSLSEAQQKAAKLEPKINIIYQTLQQGEKAREREFTPRWQAGYDLAMGRAMAAKVRTEAYNQMLAMAKRGMKFEGEKNNTWVLQPADNIEVGSQMERLAGQAKTYLQRVIDEHPGTPWALLAKRELADPIGWEWKEEFTDLAPRRDNGGGGGNAGPGRDDKVKMIKRGPPKRKAPKL